MAHELAVPGASPRLVLDQITAGQQVLVQAFSTLPAALVWALMALVLVLAAFVEAKAQSSGTVAMAGAAAVLFGFIIETADQRSMALGTLWGALLAAGGGAVLGTVLGAVGRRVFKAEPAGPRGQAAEKKGGGGKKDDAGGQQP
jgi:membrane-bound ClpP family serine protease